MITGRGSFQTSLRLPDGMHPLLSDRAARNGRSMNSEIVQILERALRGEEAAGNGPEKANPAATRNDALQGAITTHAERTSAHV